MVKMKVQDGKGQYIDHAIKCRQHKSLADPGDSKDRLELGHAVHDIDKVARIHTRMIALMNAIKAPTASPDFWVRALTHTNGYRRARRCEVSSATIIS